MDWTGLRDPLYALLCSTCKKKFISLLNKLDLLKSLADYDATSGHGFINKYVIGDSIAVKKMVSSFCFPGFTVPELKYFDSDPEPSLG